MKKPLAIDAEVMGRLRGLSKAERVECLQTLCDLCDAFGRPHVHGGSGIRKLGGHLFECRVNLQLRFVFFDRADSLYVRLLGNHDEVREFLKGAKR